MDSDILFSSGAFLFPAATLDSSVNQRVSKKRKVNSLVSMDMLSESGQSSEALTSAPARR